MSGDEIRIRLKESKALEDLSRCVGLLHELLRKNIQTEKSHLHITAQAACIRRHLEKQVKRSTIQTHRPQIVFQIGRDE